MTGSPDEAPYIPAVGLGDVSTGAHAALAILAALRPSGPDRRGPVAVLMSQCAIRDNYNRTLPIA